VPFLLCAATVVPTIGQTVTTLASFDNLDGTAPQGPLAQGQNGNFYGTTSYGGSQSSGTAFRIAASGLLETIYSFCAVACLHGGDPFGGLMLATGGNFYGTTSGGGAQLVGTVFKLSPAGALSTIYSLCGCQLRRRCFTVRRSCAGRERNLYGTTETGGAGNAGMSSRSLRKAN